MQAGVERHPHRTTARLIGASFLVSTAAYMLGTSLIEALIGAPDMLRQISASGGQLVSGVLLQLVNSAAVVAIGVLFYPVTRRQSEAVALGYVAARVLESVLLAIGGLAALALLGVSGGGTGEVSALLVSGSRAAYHVAMIALGLGSLFFCTLLYRTALIPRWLSALGLVGYAALLVGSALELYGLDLRLVHNLPGGIFELVLPIWLLVRGFNSPRPGAMDTATTGSEQSKWGSERLRLR